MKKKLLFLSAFLVLLAFGCKKDDPTLIEVLQSGKWKIAGVKFNGTDAISSIEACELDNFTRYNTDNTYVVDEGATKCDSTDPQINEEGTYSISTDEKTLTLKNKGTISFAIDLTVVSFSETSLVLVLEDGSDKLEYTFKK